MSSGMIGSADQPDPDAIKMFVGQIPRSMDEEKLRIMFEEYGKVHQINVLRDKVTSQSKGKSQLLYYTLEYLNKRSVNFMLGVIHVVFSTNEKLRFYCLDQSNVAFF